MGAVGAGNPSGQARKRTRKGEREATRIIEAATTALARDGFAGATLGRIAAEADVDKRMVTYYFGSREVVLAHVVRWLGERVAVRVEEALGEVPAERGPGPVAEAVIDALLSTSFAEPELPRAYMALLTGSRDAEVQAEMRAIKERFLALFERHLDALEAHGYALVDGRDGYATLMYAIVRGLVLDWADDGESATLRAAIERFKQIAASGFASGR
jgi:AcrR family transcriptional regulator